MATTVKKSRAIKIDLPGLQAKEDARVAALPSYMRPKPGSQMMRQLCLGCMKGGGTLKKLFPRMKASPYCHPGCERGAFNRLRELNEGVKRNDSPTDAVKE